MRQLFDNRITVKRPAEPDVDWLLMEAFGILDRAVEEHAANAVLPLCSGGHDSVTVCHVASQHWSAPEPFMVHHIDTGTGAEATRRYVEMICSTFGWDLRVWKSEAESDSIEAIMRELGPGMHLVAYMRLKHCSVTAMCDEYAKGTTRPAALISGVRAAESVRRMGHAVEIQRGRLGKDGRMRDANQMFVSPCLHWTARDQAFYMDEMGIPANPVKVATGKSGECNCGCYAKPGERDAIRKYTPDVDDRLTQLEAIAADHGKPCIWGQSPCRAVETDDAFVGQLCFGCDRQT